MSKEDLENIEELLERHVRENNGDEVIVRRRGGTFSLHGLLTKVRKELGLVNTRPAA